MGRHPKPFTIADHRADFGECPLLEDEPPFLPSPCLPSKHFLLFSISTFLIGCLGPRAAIEPITPHCHPCRSKLAMRKAPAHN